MKMYWYVINVKTNSEKKAADSLTRKKIENYFPVRESVKDISFDSKVIQKPLFKSYNFVYTTEKNLSEIKNIPAVSGIVHWLGKPVVITEAEIDGMKRFLNDHINIRVEKIMVQKDDAKTFDSILNNEASSEVKANNKVNIILPSIGFKLMAEVPTSKVRIISSGNFAQLPKVKTPKLFNIANIFNNF